MMMFCRLEKWPRRAGRPLPWTRSGEHVGVFSTKLRERSDLELTGTAFALQHHSQNEVPKVATGTAVYAVWKGGDW
jgi:hypothetical protein